MSTLTAVRTTVLSTVRSCSGLGSALADLYVTNTTELNAYLATLDPAATSDDWDSIWPELGYADAGEADDALYGDPGILKSDIAAAWLDLNTVIESSLLAAWPMTETGSNNRQLIDGYGGYTAFGGYYLDPTGSNTLATSGVLNGASFVPSNYFTTPSFSGVYGTASRWVSCWVDTTLSSRRNGLYSSGAAGAGTYFDIYIENTGELVVKVGTGESIYTTVLNDGSLHHVAVSVPLDASVEDCVVWIDGALDTRSSFVTETVNTAYGSATRWGAAIDTFFRFDGTIYQPLLGRGELDADLLDYIYNAGSGRSVTDIEAYRDQYWDVYILAGQSNASGRATGTPETAGSSFVWDSVSVNTRVRSLVYGTNHNAGGDSLVSEFGCQFSLLEPKQETRRPVLLLSADGGTNLHTDWDPSGGSNYTTLTTEIANLKARAVTDGATIRWRGMVWAQGEADGRTDNATAPSTYYETDLNTLISNIRGLTDAALKVAIAKPKIGATQTATYDQIGEVQTAQDAVAAADALITAIDTSTYGQDDDLHFNAAGQALLGAAAAAILD